MSTNHVEYVGAIPAYGNNWNANISWHQHFDKVSQTLCPNGRDTPDPGLAQYNNFEQQDQRKTILANRTRALTNWPDFENNKLQQITSNNLRAIALRNSPEQKRIENANKKMPRTIDKHTSTNHFE